MTKNINALTALKSRKKQLYKLIIARSDIYAAMTACELLMEKVRPDDNTKEAKIKALGNKIYYPLLNAIVVCYARPFSANKPLGPLPSRWHAFSNARYQEVHKNLLELRDKMIAHSDAEHRKVKIIPHGAPRPQAVGGISEGVSILIYNEYLGIDLFPHIRATCRDLASRLHVEIEKESEYLYGNLHALPEEIDLLEDIKNVK